MARGVARYLVGSLVVLGLAACGKVMFAERDAWRHEAEVACLKSGQVKEGPSLARIEPISGPGICGADFPLKVAAIGDGAPIGFADECVRPARSRAASRSLRRRPATIRVRPITIRIRRSRKPIRRKPIPEPPRRTDRCRSGRPAASRPTRDDDIEYEDAQPGQAPAQAYPPRPQYGAPPKIYPQRPQYGAPAPYEPVPYEPAPDNRAPTTSQPYPPQSYPPRGAEQVPLGRERAPVATGAVAVQPTATLACPIVSALDTWFASGVQPAALKWFGVQVAEIRQISAYSCRGMNGQPARASRSMRSAMRSISRRSRLRTDAR